MAGINIDTAGIGQAVGALGGLAKDIRAAITGQAILDPTKQAELDGKLADIDAQVMAAQSAINLAEVAKGGFAGNWRPFVGWVCGIGFAFKFLVAPFLTYFSLPVPPLDSGEMLTLLLALFGMVGARTVEKVKGVAR